MIGSPVICFGQQPCGIFPRRFLVAKIQTARRLQSEIGGRIVFFYHDADHDPRETQTILHHRATGEPATLNFTFENKIQRKYSPLFLKRIPKDWHAHTARQLPNYVDRPLVEMFEETSATTVANFCLEMYRRMNLLNGIEVVRSSDPAVRTAACDVAEFFVDTIYEDEIVRARPIGDHFQLHAGGNQFINFPIAPFTKSQTSPTRDSRLVWMQSVIRCTHYVCGAGEQDYMNTADTPEITFIKRDIIERSDEGWTENP
jgi:hypothetical protein